MKIGPCGPVCVIHLQLAATLSPKLIMVFQSVAFYFRCFFTQDHVEDERGSAAGDCYSASEASWPFEVASAV